VRRILIIATTIVIGFCFTGVDLNANPQLVADLNSEFVASPEKQFAQAIRLAKQGQVAQGVALADLTLKAYPTDVRIKLTYIESLVEIQRVPGGDRDVDFLSQAIRVATEVQEIKECNGNHDPALGFGYLRALGQLAYAVEPKQPNICVELKHLIGGVAENLLQNPRVAQDSHKYLALPFFDKAKAHASRGEGQLVAESLEVAFKLGFSDFDRAQKEVVLKNLGNADEIQKIIQRGSDLVIKQKEAWAKKEIAGFFPYVYVFDVDGLNQGRITNNEFKGKILVVDLWATWCPPCKNAIPHFKQLQHEFRDKNVEVLGISVDNPDSPVVSRSIVQEFVKEHNFNFACGLGGHSVLNQVPGETSLPTTLFIDASGNVRYVTKGYHPYAELKALTEEMIRIAAQR